MPRKKTAAKAGGRPGAPEKKWPGEHTMGGKKKLIQKRSGEPHLTVPCSKHKKKTMGSGPNGSKPLCTVPLKKGQEHSLLQRFCEKGKKKVFGCENKSHPRGSGFGEGVLKKKKKITTGDVRQSGIRQKKKTYQKRFRKRNRKKEGKERKKKEPQEKIIPRKTTNGKKSHWEGGPSPKEKVLS